MQREKSKRDDKGETSNRKREKRVKPDENGEEIDEEEEREKGEKRKKETKKREAKDREGK